MKNKIDTTIIRINGGKDQVTEIVRKEIDKFVTNCLESEYDVLIPIQDEGLAILLPKLHEVDKNRPEIFPSNSLQQLDPKVLEGKTVLLVESAVRFGGELREVSKQIHEKFHVKSISFAAFLVLEGFPSIDDLKVPGSILLSPNQYLWAKEIIMEYLLNEVFIRFGDPPLWEFKVSHETSLDLLNTLLQYSNVYMLPNTDHGNWFRISIDGIQLNDRSWLDDNIDIVQPNKVRILIHKRDGRVNILPLIFPKIPGNSTIPVSNLLERLREVFSERFSDIFSKILKLSEEAAISPYNSFRWISVMGSILLLKDFYNFVESVNIHLGKIKLLAPIPNLYQYSCSEAILSAFQELAQELTNPNINNGQYVFPRLFFNIIKDEEISQESLTLKPPYNKYSPEEGLIMAFGDWIYRNSNQGSEQTNRTIEIGLPLKALHQYYPFMSDRAANRALDTLIDEGIVKPRIGRDVNGNIVRTYTVGGEYVKLHLLALGRAVEINRLNSIEN